MGSAVYIHFIVVLYRRTLLAFTTFPGSVSNHSCTTPKMKQPNIRLDASQNLRGNPKHLFESWRMSGILCAEDVRPIPHLMVDNLNSSVDLYVVYRITLLIRIK
ncbi:hypothetical protein NPIL_83081 [Nephila pilipes]|uniref:Uncharacterized protein n=1 Tax=Nephila pilipes TaxID=299642 RepID=A0A8X6PA51_NEPPI|nr:hypothetical protein NPIL_268181 [Nephila pilipes]GFT55625.1 hypothetical protein NPIL_485091 [Nephila pilipes]GFT55638.1 hypothetical protein NPIL_636821 [Nephila pilipes]GFT82523.1 hypothetical protein NPIL_83081 [Nephila pilipes]